MLATLALVLYFGWVGMSVLRLLDRSANAYLAPAFGAGCVIFLAYAISANFGITGADATAFSIGLFAAFSVVTWIVPRFRARHQFSDVLHGIPMAVLSIMPSLALLFPAMIYGVDNFFGAVNFDFFYNSQDSIYLITHSVSQHPTIAHDGVTLGILPLSG
jgi:hypothetical protein